jgi:hypothetical protein
MGDHYRWTMELPSPIVRAHRTMTAVYFRLRNRPESLFFISEDGVIARCDGGDGGDEDKSCTSSD